MKYNGREGGVPGQTAELPFRADVGTRSQHDEQTLLFRLQHEPAVRKIQEGERVCKVWNPGRSLAETQFQFMGTRGG